MTKTLDLDLIHPEPKILKLGGKSFDVTRMPVAIFLDVQKKAEEKTGLSVEEYRGPLTTWLQSLDPSVTPEWVNSITDDTQVLLAIRNRIFNSVFSDPLQDWISDLPSQETEKKAKGS